MTDTDFEARVARSLQARAEGAVEPFDASQIAETAIGASRPRDRRMQMVLAAAVVALAVVGTAGAIVVGSGVLNPRPNPPVVPSPQPDTTPGPEVPLGGGLILAYRPHESADECSLGSLAPFDVLTVDPGTGAQTVLGTTAEDCSARWLNFQWAPDRAHILMTDELGQEALTLDTRTAAAPDLTFICCDLPTDVWEGGSHYQGWVLSPAGDRVAAIHTTGPSVIADGIVIANLDGSGRTTLALPAGAEIRGAASWSPDQSALLVAACLPCNHARLGQPATAENHEHLYVVPVDGSPVQEFLDDAGGWLWTPAWSPDASTFATMRRACLSEWVPLECSGAVTSSLLLVDAETGTQRVVISGEQLGDDLEVGPPVWSSDGTRIAFTSYTESGDPVRVFVADADGANVTDLGEGSLIQWSPDDEWLLVSRPSGIDQFIDLWIMRPDGSDARSLGTFLGSFTAPAAW